MSDLSGQHVNVHFWGSRGSGFRIEAIGLDLPYRPEQLPHKAQPPTAMKRNVYQKLIYNSEACIHLVGSGSPYLSMCCMGAKEGYIGSAL